MFWHLASEKKPKELKDKEDRIYNFVLVRILSFGHEGFIVARYNPENDEWLQMRDNTPIGQGKWKHTTVTHWQNITFEGVNIEGELYV